MKSEVVYTWDTVYGFIYTSVGVVPSIISVGSRKTIIDMHELQS